MKNSGIVYEHLVQEIYEEILKNEGINNIKVEHDVKLKGRSTTHQIDVYWEHEIGNTKFRTIIQAKDWKSAVPQKEMLAFAEIIKDLPTGTKGIFISKSGYQKGAIDVAKAHGIDLYVLREPSADDFNNKMMKLELRFIIEGLYYSDINLVIDQNLNSNITENCGLKISNDLVIYERDSKIAVGSLIADLCEENGSNISKREHKFNEGFIIFDNQKIFVDKLVGQFGISETIEIINIDSSGNIGYILEDIINKESKIFDRKNRFIKDLKE